MTYPHHIPTTFFQKSLLTVGSAITAILDPSRDDMVACMGETASSLILPQIKRKMMNNKTGRKILIEEPRILNRTVDLEHFRKLKDGTLGREYVKFLDKLLLYVMQRYRETHDMFHVCLEMPTTILGEVVVKWIEGIQFGLPMCFLGGLFGSLRLYPKQRRKFLDSYFPWAVKNSSNGEFLMNVYWEHHWDKPLKELRKEINFEDPPH
uniref:Ubiquinone biosynthesis protein COQ4 homolog, mitochondrial n=1 Tax=Romanomermis culicivorax TaxID=13658 RepID=A0A915J907_ROMCU